VVLICTQAFFYGLIGCMGFHDFASRPLVCAWIPFSIDMCSALMWGTVHDSLSLQAANRACEPA
jgi:hypothetical protein